MLPHLLREYSGFFKVANFIVLFYYPCLFTTRRFQQNFSVSLLKIIGFPERFIIAKNEKNKMKTESIETWFSQDWDLWMIRLASPLLKYSIRRIIEIYVILGITLPAFITWTLCRYQSPSKMITEVVVPLSFPALTFWAVLGAIFAICIFNIVVKRLCLIWEDIKWVFASKSEFNQFKKDFWQTFNNTEPLNSPKKWLQDPKKVLWGSLIVLGWPFLGVGTYFFWTSTWAGIPITSRIGLLIFYVFAIVILHSGIVWAGYVIYFLFGKASTYLRSLRFLPYAPDRMSGLRSSIATLLMLTSLWISVTAITWPAIVNSLVFDFSRQWIKWVVWIYGFIILLGELITALSFWYATHVIGKWIQDKKQSKLYQYYKWLESSWDQHTTKVGVWILKMNKTESVKTSPASGKIVRGVSLLASIGSFVLSLIF